MRIIDLAYRDPKNLGYDVSQWSLSLLVAEIKKQEIAEQISEKSVSRFFKNEVDLHPHKIRYWLHSSEKTDAPEAFALKVNENCGLYQSAREQSRKEAHIVSTDEMTGVQALEH